MCSQMRTNIGLGSFLSPHELSQWAITKLDLKILIGHQFCTILHFSRITLVSVFIPGSESSYTFFEINLLLSIRSTPNFVSVDSCYKQRNWASRINRISDNVFNIFWIIVKILSKIKEITNMSTLSQKKYMSSQNLEWKRLPRCSYNDNGTQKQVTQLHHGNHNRAFLFKSAFF